MQTNLQQLQESNCTPFIVLVVHICFTLATNDTLSLSTSSFNVHCLSAFKAAATRHATNQLSEMF